MKRLLIIMACLPWIANLWANPITVDQARQKASRFLQGQVARKARRAAPAAQQMKMAAKGRDDTYYIFNTGDNGGYVVVSGDDATEEILGYSNSGSINPDSIPCGMKVLLNSYFKQINYIREKGIRTVNNVSRNIRQAFHVDESRLARFGQGTPYNDYCPKRWAWDWEGISPVSKTPCATGCIATAMAELMYAYQWPRATTNTIPAYKTETDEYEIEEIAAGTPIDWTNILSRYNDGSTASKEKAKTEAIANLMKYCGASVRMDYGKSSSAPRYSVTYPLKHYFGFSSDLIYRRYEYYNSDSWTELICQELQKGYPILYAGVDDNEDKAHAFILEGYNENGYFDINFGLEGNDNISDEENVCSMLLFVRDGLENDLLKYCSDMGAVFNVTPLNNNLTPQTPICLYPEHVSFKEKSPYWRASNNGFFENVLLTWQCYNFMPVDNSYFDYGILVTKDGVQQGDVIPIKTSVSLPFGDVQYTLPTSFSCGQNWTNGFYNFHFVSKETGSSEWILSDNFENVFQPAWVYGNLMSIISDEDEINNSRLEIKDFQLSTSEQMRVGKNVDMDFSVINQANDDYEGEILIMMVRNDALGQRIEEIIGIFDANLKPKQTMSVATSLTLTVIGEQNIYFLNKHWDEIGHYTIKVIAADESLDMLEVKKMTIENQNPGDGSIDGTYLKGSLTIHNMDDVAKKECIKVRLWDTTVGFIRSYPIQVNIDSDQSITYNFSFGNLTVGHSYRVWAFYDSGKEFFESEPMLCKDEDTGETIEGNENLASYEYWFDDDYAHREIVSINSSKAVVRSSIDTDHLENGVHRLNFRLKRNDGKYSAVNSTTFLKLEKEQQGHLDYWIDDDVDNVQSLEIQDTEEEQSLTLDLANCPSGYHKLSMKVATPGSVMGSVQTVGFLKLDQSDASRLEYWFDNDIANKQTLTGKHAYSSDDYIYTDQLDLSELSPGLHRLNFRPVSSVGHTKGSVLSCNVLKLSKSKATQLEYWFDDDVENKVLLDGQAVSDGFIIDNQLDLSGLSFGLHRLNFCATSSDGTNKSSLITCTVMKTGSGPVTKLQYWFDGDFSKRRTISSQAGDGLADIIFANDLNISGISPGHHRLYYRGISDNGLTSTAVSSTPVLVKINYGNEGDAKMASYSLIIDNDSVVSSGSMSATKEAVLNYTLDTGNLKEGTHTLRSIFWNSYGACITDLTSFVVLPRDFLLGDVNRDGTVNVTDAVCILNYILGNTPSNFFFKAADINKDAIINITDVVGVMNIIMNGNRANSPKQEFDLLEIAP